MSVPPNLQKLIIPGKNSSGAHPGYATDARTIEQWANEGIVRKLIAGSGITLTPSSGVDAGTGIEIAASGGGGGGEPGIMSMFALPESSLIGTPRLVYLGADSTGNAGGTISLGQSDIALWSNPPIGALYTFGVSWFVSLSYGGVGPAPSVNILPEFIAPAFTGGPLSLTVNMGATNMANTQAFHAEGAFSLTTGQDYQTQTTDYSLTSNIGTHLSFVNGSGQNGNGIVLSTASADQFLCSIWGDVTVPLTTTITPGP